MKRLENEEFERIRNEAEDLDIMDPLAVGKALSTAQIERELHGMLEPRHIRLRSLKAT